MATFPGTGIELAQSASARVNRIVDQYLNPRIGAFREICIFDEEGSITPDRAHWKWTYRNWNEAYSLIFRKNGVVLKPNQFGPIDYGAGTIHDPTIDAGADGRPLDQVELTYQFNYFPIDLLQGIIEQMVDFINTAAVGPPTAYTVEDMPDYWDGVVTDASYAVCMERLLLDFTLWKGRLVFALGPNELESGGGDITSQLTTLKENAESRVSSTIQNERFKVGMELSPPTQAYYNAVRGIGGRMYGPHGGYYGRWRGYKPTRIYAG